MSELSLQFSGDSINVHIWVEYSNKFSILISHLTLTDLGLFIYLCIGSFHLKIYFLFDSRIFSETVTYVIFCGKKSHFVWQWLSEKTKSISIVNTSCFKYHRKNVSTWLHSWVTNKNYLTSSALLSQLNFLMILYIWFF